MNYNTSTYILKPKPQNNDVYTYIMFIIIYSLYRKRQKLCGREVLWFVRFYHNVGKAFVLLLLTSTKTTFRIFIYLHGTVIYFMEVAMSF